MWLLKCRWFSELVHEFIVLSCITVGGVRRIDQNSILLVSRIWEFLVGIWEAVEHRLIQIHHEWIVCWRKLHFLASKLLVEVWDIESVPYFGLERWLNFSFGYFIPVDMPEKEMLANFCFASPIVDIYQGSVAVVVRWVSAGLGPNWDKHLGRSLRKWP